MLDHMLVEINNRFSFRQMQAVKGFGIFHSIICRSKLIERKKRLSDIVDFVSTFQSDLPDTVTIEAQLDLWRKYWEKTDREKLPKCISTTLRQIDSKVFPAIHSMLRILGTLPMTSCTVERSASTLRRIKTWLRSTMAEKRLNSLALMHVHKDVTIDTEAIIDRFARKHPRRSSLKVCNYRKIVREKKILKVTRHLIKMLEVTIFGVLTNIQHAENCELRYNHFLDFPNIMFHFLRRLL